ncbi:MAG TPA: hypothetical protein VF230_00885 [Acidimicrobiales bacterium]
MDDARLDALVASTAAISDDDLAGLDISGLESLVEEIMSRNELQSHPRRSVWPFRAAVSAAAAAVIVVALFAGQDLGRRGTAWAAPLVAMAEATPRLVVDAPGWEVTRADEFGADTGEMTFSDGKRSLELRWQPAGAAPALSKDRAASSDHFEPVTVLGEQATLYRYGGTTDYTTVWTDGDHALEARGAFRTLAAYKEVLASLRRLDANAWLDAMPASAVRPAERAAAVRAILADIPQPDGFDPSRLETSASVRDRYQLGAAVAGAVACGWIESWVRATDAGDAAAAARAVAAMGSSRDWDILDEMNPDGDYPEVLWEYADAMKTGAPVPAGKVMTVREAYRSALGCTP